MSVHQNVETSDLNASAKIRSAGSHVHQTGGKRDGYGNDDALTRGDERAVRAGAERGSLGDGDARRRQVSRFVVRR